MWSEGRREAIENAIPRCAPSGVRGWTLAVCLVATIGCPRTHPQDVAPAPGAAQAPASPLPERPGESAEGTEIELIEAFRNGAIDTAGPVVDLGEPQAAPFIVGVRPTVVESVNGESWAAVTSRLRLRLPLTPDGSIDDPSVLPTSVRLRVRHATARSVAVIADGLLVRTALLPTGGAAATINLPVPPDRFRSGVTELELRFIGPRNTAAGQPAAPAAELDWVQLARTDAQPARVSELVGDVRVESTPRRALTLYPPTTLSVVRILPPGAVWTAAIAAEAPQGGTHAPVPVTARLRAETDGIDPIELRVDVLPNMPWREVSLNLGPLGGRAVRLSVSAEGTGARLAIASPRIMLPAAPPVLPLATARHVVLVVLRGARLDRFVPTLAPRLTAGGFSRMLRDGVCLPVASPAPREFSALVSATTGLAADLHRMVESTDLLDEDAPTLASVASTAGVAASAYTDDAAWIDSGADRGFVRRVRCPGDVATCHADGLFTAAADDIVRTRDQPSLSVIVTRAGIPPFEPAADVIASLDPQPYEGTMTPAQSGLLATRGRRFNATLPARELDRLGMLYDASLLGVDRALAGLLDRLRDQGLDATTLVIVVGDRGSALYENAMVGDGPATLGAVSTTVLLARGPGVTATPDGGVVDVSVGGALGVIDAAATALAALGVAAPAEWDALPIGRARARWGRVLPVVAGPRGEPGVRFGALFGISRPAGVSLYDPLADPMGTVDLAGSQPVARSFAENALAGLRAGVGERRVYQPSTRVLPPAVEAAMHPSRR